MPSWPPLPAMVHLQADALCDRIGIMARGTLCCLGDTMHLKNKFGMGYSLEVVGSKLGTCVDEVSPPSPFKNATQCLGPSASVGLWVRAFAFILILAGGAIDPVPPVPWSWRVKTKFSQTMECVASNLHLLLHVFVAVTLVAQCRGRCGGHPHSLTVTGHRILSGPWSALPDLHLILHLFLPVIPSSSFSNKSTPPPVPVQGRLQPLRTELEGIFGSCTKPAAWSQDKFSLHSRPA